MKKRYELTFFGGATAADFPRYKRYHATKESVTREIAKVQDILKGRNGVECHVPVIYDAAGNQYNANFAMWSNH